MEKKPKNSAEELGWRELVQGFVGNLLTQMGDNIAHKSQIWLKSFKKQTLGALLMAGGLVFFLVGLATYASYMLDHVLPGFGYIVIGILVILVGYLVTRSEG